MLSAIIKYKFNFLACPIQWQLINPLLTLIGPLVLKSITFYFTFVADRNQTVLQRSKPSSCTILIGEQPNPWSHLQLQDMISRHRGAKHFHR
jgi:hypothetical protein